MIPTRRQLLQSFGAAALVPAMTTPLHALDDGALGDRQIATNTYPWLTFANRDKINFDLHSDQLLGDIAGTGISGYEPIINSVQEFDGLLPRLTANGLEMRSIYVNSELHDADKSDASIATVISIASAAKKLGTEIIVTNPSPIRWGGPENKSDEQLRHQAASLDTLGADLQRIGMTLAYHNHDAELRMGGREFHHMLTATDPGNVKLCLDAHWVFRGCGDSQVAVFDALSHYHERIVELHLRQSVSGIWSDVFTMDGDIDYQRLFDFLKERSINPHLVLEQAVEAKSPSGRSVTQAHQQSRNNLKAATA